MKQKIITTILVIILIISIYSFIYVLASLLKPPVTQMDPHSIFNPKIEVYQCKNGTITAAVKNGITLCRTADSLSLQSEGEQNRVITEETDDQQIVVSFYDPFLAIATEKELLIIKIYSQREMITILKEERKMIPTGIVLTQKTDSLSVYLSGEITAEKVTDIKTKVELIEIEKEIIKDRKIFSFSDFFRITDIFQDNGHLLLKVNETYPFFEPEVGLLEIDTLQILRNKCWHLTESIPTINSPALVYLHLDCDTHLKGYYYLSKNGLTKIDSDGINIANDQYYYSFSHNMIRRKEINQNISFSREIGLNLTSNMQVVGKGSIINPAGRSDYFDFAESNRFIYRLFL